MDVIWPNVTLQYFYVVTPTYLAYQLSHSKRHLSPKYRFAVLWYEHKVIVQLVNRVR